MKKQYTQPKLVILGNVESLTQAFGAATHADTFTYNGAVLPGTHGSQDGVVVPR